MLLVCLGLGVLLAALGLAILPELGAAVHTGTRRELIETVQALPDITPLPTPASEPCKQKILAAAASGSGSAPAYTAQPGGGTWQVNGISGELRAFQWDAYNDGPRFDLVQVYYRRSSVGAPLWAAVGVTLPPYYTIYDSASYRRYHADGHGSEPYYFSFTEGIHSHAEAVQAFSEPGAYLVTLAAGGDYVSREGIDWSLCTPQGSEYCLLAGLFESLAPPLDDLPYPGVSNWLIHTGTARSDPVSGFLLWPLRLEQALNLCQPVARR